MSSKKLRFEYYKNCLEATQPDDWINPLEMNKIGVDSIKTNDKEFIKSNKLILKRQQ